MGEITVNVTSLMTALSRANVNLNSLHLHNIPIDSNGVRSISNLNKLEYSYESTCLHTVQCVSGELISLVGALPLLSTLKLRFHDLGSFSVIDFIKMVKAGK